MAVQIESSAQKRRQDMCLAASLLALTHLVSGCAVVAGTAAVGVGTASVAGYSVYETGESVVTGGSGDKSSDPTAADSAEIRAEATQQFPRPKPKPKSPPPEVYYKNEFKVTCDASVERVWTTAKSTLPRMAIVLTGQNLDTSSATITAETLENVPIVLKMESLGPESTLLRIRVGTSGDLKFSELIYNLIRDDLHPTAEPATTAGPAKDQL
jgi:hypothetical protein